MRMVVLDGYTLNPGDLSWDGLRELGEVTVYDRTSPSEIVAHAQDAEVVFTNKTPISEETMELLPHLRYIGVLATGYNIVDIEAAKARGIVVTNIPDYSTYSVAQHTIALLLALVNQVQPHSDEVRQGAWSAAPDFSFTIAPLTELYGKTIGLFGHGLIGQQVGRIALALGMRVLCVRRQSSPAVSLYGESYVDLDEFLAEADIVSLHCPLTAETEGFINKDTIAAMKDGAIILNSSRGALVKEQDLAEALLAGKIAGAGLDVLSTEPPQANNPLLEARNCIITPHIAWASKEARSRLLEICIDNVQQYLQGNPINNVGGELCTKN